MLIPQVNRVAWLNLLPRFHWRDTTAEFIAKINSLVPMFALEPAEYQQMLQWLLYGKNVKSFLAQADQKSSQQKQFGTFNIWDIGEYNAKGKIQAFNIMFGEVYTKFASHAAFPLLLTPDLLYCLWWKFFREPGQKSQTVPWYAVADVLLSDLCQEVDVELYEMPAEVRDELLSQCQDKFGEKRLQELSEFLIKYIERQVNKQKPDFLLRDLLQVNQWTALAYTQKGDEAAKQLAEKLRQAYLQNNKAELVRLSEVIATLAAPLKEKYAPLLVVARGYRALVRGDEEGKVAAQTELKQMLGVGETVDVAGVILERPDILNLIRLSPPFEIVTVNRRGEIIRRETKQAKYFTEYLSDSISLEMMAIPGGTFLMGSPETEAGRRNSESPQHEVTVPPFFMGKYPVTQAQWRFVATLEQVNRELEPDPSSFKGENLPIETISWYEAVEFCDRLSKYTGRRYQLPSEAQWEYACRAGTTTPFHFGETITSDLANYNAEFAYADSPKGEFREKTTPVGSFGLANAFGLYDMHGLVWEWCADSWHGNYDGAPADGSSPISRKVIEKYFHHLRVLRGGSWISNPGLCRSASRGNDDGSIGFRVVCAVSHRTLNP
ncbi:MAG: formylglycine-generating enzyme family protein [Aetokthonos hydrillicola CCALA 1050]|nr:formylglycine-generating enzyme family protein [Aetokthonos hydrillicola CCALA 1050]